MQILVIIKKEKKKRTSLLLIRGVEASRTIAHQTLWLAVLLSALRGVWGRLLFNASELISPPFDVVVERSCFISLH